MKRKNLTLRLVVMVLAILGAGVLVINNAEAVVKEENSIEQREGFFLAEEFGPEKPVYAAGIGSLFIEVPVTTEIELLQQQAADDPTIIRSRYVQIDLVYLAQAESGVPGVAGIEELNLNLFTDVSITAVKEHTEKGYSDRFSWIGSIPGAPGDQVILVIDGGSIVGSITIEGKFYQVRDLGSGVHAIYEIDQSAFPPESPPIPVTEPEGDFSPGAAAPAAADDPLIDGIDVMVVYSEAAANQTGNIVSEIQLAVTWANQSYINSGINLYFNLVYTAEVTYTESGYDGLDLGRLRETNDGFLDEVHQWRNTYNADIVNLWYSSGQCGTAYLMQTVSNSFQKSAFSVVRRDCAAGYVFAHELGHNMGAHHDRYVTTSEGAYSYSYGYVDTGDAWRTIMAYANECGAVGISCPIVQYWSNPDVSHPVYGTPMGVPEGDPDSADNAKTLNNTALTVANFRPDTIPPAGESIIINSEEAYTNSRDVTLFLTAADAVGVTGYYVSEDPATPSAADFTTIDPPAINYYSTVTNLSSFDALTFVGVWSRSPKDVSAAADGTLWVVDNFTDEIYHITDTGTLLSSFPVSTFDGSADYPSGISAAADGTLWVSDHLARMIYHITDTGALLSSFPTSAFDAGAISLTGVSAAADGTLWVSDWNTTNIYHITDTGTLLSSFPTSVFDAGTTGPTGISAAADGTLWVSDASIDKIYHVTDTGMLLDSFPTSAYGTGATPAYPTGISAAQDGTLWICHSDPRFIYHISGLYYIPFTLSDGAGEKTVYAWLRDWTENISSPASDTIILDSDEVTLSLLKGGIGTGRVMSSPAGIDCGTDCTENYNEVTVVTLTAAPDTGSFFADWSGGGCSGTGDCVVTMDSDVSVVATFTLILTPPVPDIKANDSDGPVTIAQGDNLIVTVSLDPGSNDGTPADWYIYTPISPLGPYYYIYPGGWVPGFGITYSGPLFSLTPFTVLNMTGLPIGAYTICFDLDTGVVYSDCVEVTIE